MYNLKGFIRYSDLISNVNGVVSTFGEMSPLALSYAKEKGYYTQPGVNGIELVSMSGLLTVGLVTSKAPSPAEVSELSILVAQWVHDNAENSSLFVEVDGQYPAYMAALTAHFTGVGFTHFDFANLTMGPILTMEIESAADKRMPAWLAWSMTYNESSTEYPGVCKIWFSDVAFRNEFPEYEIVVVPPIENLDDFFLALAPVTALIDAYTRPLMMEKIAEAIGIHPPTLVKTYMYDWYDNLDPPNILPTPWTVVIYGMAGDNYDLIVEAIRQYILDNSTHTQSEWEEVFPDIFKTTEFIITPMWNRYSIPNMTLQAGVYSPMVNFNQDIDEVLLTMAPMPEPHVRLHIMSGLFMYKSLSFYVCGSQNNRDNLFDFTDVFPDYVAVSTDSLDFGKMSAKTQAWVIFILDLVKKAEEMTSSSSIPFNATRIVRGGIMYIAAFYDNIQYLITAKQYFEDEVPPPEDL